MFANITIEDKGGNMSLWWQLGAQAGLSALGSFLGGSQANQQLAGRFDQTRIQNEAVAESNRLNLQNTMFNQGMVKVQEGLNKQQNIRNRLSLGIGETTDRSEVSLNQNAIGAVGASADAVLNDVSKKYADANIELAQQKLLEGFQTNSNTQQAWTQYWQNLGKIDTSGVGMKVGSNIGTHLLGGVLSAGTGHIERELTLNLGNKKSNGIQLESLKGR